MESVRPGEYPKTYVYPPEQPLTLEAMPAPGYRFVSWSGDVDADGETASVTMSCDKNVTAVFAPIPHAPMIHTEPRTGGEVTMEPQPSAEDGFAPGTQVTLTAIAAEGYRFSHWSGDVSGEANPVIVLTDSAREVNAHFVEAPPFAWWWIGPGVGVVVIALPLYFLVVRRPRSSPE